METLEKLFDIGDGDFETLITLYLRQRDPDLKALIATGVNAEGKAINCPVDAVVYVPGPSERLVHVAATTYDESGIVRKWLGGKKGSTYEIGDIQKARDEFDKWTDIEPTVPRQLFLAWNRLLAKNTQLYRDIVQRSHQLGMEVELVEASQLVGFLDHDPEGQYLRQEFLGIDAFRLSESLLRKIAILSLNHHEQAFATSNDAARVEIERDAGRDLDRALSQDKGSLIGLIAPSGAGKSTLVRQHGRQLNSKETICLWVPAEEFGLHTSAAALLRRVLLQFYPALNERAGDDALEIATMVQGGLVLLVDDVNRVASPAEALEIIRACARSDVEMQKGQETQLRLRFVIPLWPNQLGEQLSDHKQEWETVHLDFYSLGERRELVKAQPQLEETTVLPLLESLGGDPFLCNLAISSLVDHKLSPASSRNTTLRTIIENLLKKATLEASASQNLATQDQFGEALSDLIELALITDQPEPRWDEIRAKLGEQSAGLLMLLGKTHRIGWVEERLDGSRWRWNHDRLRDALVGRWLARRVTEALANGDRAEVTRLLDVPGTAEAWAWVFIFTEQSIQGQVIEMIAARQPLALATALAFVEFNEPHATTQALVERLRQVLDGYSLLRERFVEQRLWPVLYRVTRTNHPLVLSITENVEDNWHVALGRFRNGDTRAGLRLMERFFGPMRMNFPSLERAVEGYLRVNSNRRLHIMQELKDELQDSGQLIPVLALCGYLRWPDLTDLAWDAWNAINEDDKQNTLLALLWALSRCATEKDQDRLEQALLRARLWRYDDKIDDEDENHGNERYDNFVEPLHFMLNGEITEASSKTIARVATDHKDLTSSMLYVLRGIDTPATMEAYVRLTAKFGGSMWDKIEATESHDEGGQRHRERIPAAQSSRERLWQIIQNDEPANVRQVALWHWKRFPVPGDLTRLQTISEDDVLFDQILQLRLRLRDRTAAPLLLDRINIDPGVWLPYCYLVFREPGVADALFKNLEVALQSDVIERQYIERIPQNLPADGVRRLVLEKRDLLFKTPRMWNSLWRSNGTEALEFLRDAIPRANAIDLERFAVGSGNTYPVTQKMLDALQPVLKYFPDDGHHWLTTLILNSGRADWLEASELEKETAGFKGSIRWWLNEEDGRNVFDEAARAVPNGPTKVQRTAHYYDIERQTNKVAFDSREALKRWLEESQSADKIIVAGMLLARIGTGDDASWWNHYKPEVGSDAFETWEDALYILRRRRWQKHD